MRVIDRDGGFIGKGVSEFLVRRALGGLTTDGTTVPRVLCHTAV